MYLVRLSPAQAGKDGGQRPPWDVLAWTDSRGASFVDDLRNAPPKDRDAMGMLAILETDVPLNGPNRANKNKCRPLGHKIFEFKRGQQRVLWFYDDGKCIICTHRFAKKSQKTPPQEIDLAIERRKQYLQAKAEGLIVTMQGRDDE